MLKNKRMSLCGPDFINSVAAEANLYRSDAKKIITLVRDKILACYDRDGAFLISGICTMKRRPKPGREESIKRNNLTGKMAVVPAREPGSRCILRPMGTLK